MSSNNVLVILVFLIAFQHCANATWFFPFPFPFGPFPGQGGNPGNQGNFFNPANPGQGFPGGFSDPGQGFPGAFPDPGQGGQGNHNHGQSGQGNHNHGQGGQGNVNPSQDGQGFNNPSQGGQGNVNPGQGGQSSLPDPNAAASLKLKFYDSTCPNAEKIVHDTIRKHYNKDPTVAAGILRLFFHDCFVRGCDASLLLESTPSGEPVEKDAGANGFTLNGQDVIEAVKSALESACPGIVSCADILSFAARDVAVLTGLRHFQVAGGRRDGTVSLASEVMVNLPSPLQPLNELIQMFKAKGFTPAELVVLSGAHSIGGAHCFTFIDRLYNNSLPATLDSTLASTLKRTCPFPQPNHDITKDAKVDFDPSSPLLLDASYFKKIQMGKALLSSDHALMNDRKTSTIVQRMAADPAKWKKQFTKAMIKIGKLEVLVGNQGQIRKQCKAVNN